MTKSGSENRQRTVRMTHRFTPVEAQELERRADLAAISVPAYVRMQCLNVPPPRQVRRPTVNHEAVARLLGQVGKVGSNLNQLARAANAGRTLEASIEAALIDLTEIRAVCMEALGKRP